MTSLDDVDSNIARADRPHAQLVDRVSHSRVLPARRVDRRTTLPMNVRCLRKEWGSEAPSVSDTASDRLASILLGWGLAWPEGDTPMQRAPRVEARSRPARSSWFSGSRTIESSCAIRATRGQVLL